MVQVIGLILLHILAALTFLSGCVIYFNILRYAAGIEQIMETFPRSAVDNVSGNRCESDCRSRSREFDPSQVPYFRGDWS